MQSLIEALHAAMHHANLSINADHKKISAAFILHCINLRSVNSTPWYLRYSFIRLTIEEGGSNSMTPALLRDESNEVFDRTIRNN